jgi:hypothetical protein
MLIDSVLEWAVRRSMTDLNRVKGEFSQRFFKWFAEVLKEVDTPGSGLKNWDFLNEMPDPRNFPHHAKP